MYNFSVNVWGFSYGQPRTIVDYLCFFLKEFPTQPELAWECVMSLFGQIFVEEELERLFPSVPIYVEEDGSKRLELVA